MFAVDEVRLITGQPFDVGVGITLYQPTMREIAMFGEDEYLHVVNAITSEPFDVPYYLDQMGIDFEKITPFELFCIMIKGIPQTSSRLLLGNLDLSKFRPIYRDNELVLMNPRGVVIDSITRDRLADNIRRMHGLPKNILASCENKATHNLVIAQQKKEIERAQKRKALLGDNSVYAAWISSLACVWHSYDKVLDLRVGQFFDAIVRLGYKANADNLYRGLYSGAVSFKDIKKKDLDWMRPIKIKTL